MTHLLIIIIYLAFISLGLPDGVLGSAWPSMYTDLNVSFSSVGIISMLTSGCTIVSALSSERIGKKFDAGVITVVSVGLTAIGLLGFSLSTSFWHLIVWSIPYGLGAGSIDSVLNNYVALHYKSRQMSWLHCFWGVGCICGPYIISYYLLCGKSWSNGYFTIFVMQMVLFVIILFSLPLWKKREKATEEGEEPKVYGFKGVFGIKGVKEILIAFFCYCSLESTAGMWAVSYVVFDKNISAENAAKWGSLFYIGIMVGRFVNGIISEKLSDKSLIRIGTAILATGILVLFLPLGNIGVIVSFILIGLGCAPIYPCIVHSTPDHFGKEASQAIIGIQMASAYVGTTFMPPIFGLIVENISASLLPVYLSIFFVGMVFFLERVNKIVKQQKKYCK